MHPEQQQAILTIALLAAVSLVAGCSSVGDWSGLKRRKDTTPVAQSQETR